MLTTMVTKQRRGRLYVREHMEKTGLNPTGLAKLMGVARPSVYRWFKARDEHNSRDLNTEKLTRLATIFGCDADDLWHPPGTTRLEVSKETLAELAAQKRR